jgi:hypothetical protein
MKLVFRREEPGPAASGLAGPVVILTLIAILIVTGCTDSNPQLQGSTTTFTEQRNENPAREVTAAVRTGAVTAAQAITQPAAGPVSSTGVIRLDAISDMNAGEKFTISGTTSMPEGSEILWQVIPDTGLPPEGLDPDSTMSVGGNYLVTRGNGTMNRITIAVDPGGLVPGRYAVIAGKAKERTPDKMVFEIEKDFGYAYFSLKQAGMPRAARLSPSAGNTSTEYPDW